VDDGSYLIHNTDIYSINISGRMSMTEDITYCTKQNCGYLRCERNQKHIKLPIPHSYAKLEGTEFCYKNREGVGGIVYQQD